MEKFYERAGWTLLGGLSSTLIKNVIYCIYLFVHKLKDKILYGKGWESPKDNEGSPKVFSFCINIGKLDVSKDLFSNYLCARLL